MNGLSDRLGAVNPLVWIVLALAAILGYGARKLVALMKVPEDKQQKVVVWLKGASLVLAILVFVYVLIAQ